MGRSATVPSHSAPPRPDTLMATRRPCPTSKVQGPASMFIHSAILPGAPSAQLCLVPGTAAGPAPFWGGLRRQAPAARICPWRCTRRAGRPRRHHHSQGRDGQYLLGGQGWGQGCSHLLGFPLLMLEVPSFWRNVTICPLGCFLRALCSVGLPGGPRRPPVGQRCWRNRAHRGLSACLFRPHLLALRFSVLLGNLGLLFGIPRRENQRLSWGL